MNYKKALSVFLACMTAASASFSVQADEQKNGIVYDGDSASYFQDGVALTGKFSAAPALLIGDIDGDAVVNTVDAAYILTAAASSAVSGKSVSEEMQALGLAADAADHADCNLDDNINAIDAAQILVYAAATGAGETPPALGSVCYYANAEGILQKGWILHELTAYYAGEDYVLKTNNEVIEGNSYEFDDDGALQSGWLHVGEASYCFADGKALTGIQSISEQRYYFHPETGILVCGDTVNGITTNADGIITKVLLDTPYISQIGYPTGCESASAVMLLRDAGYSTSIDTFIDTALDKGSLYSSGGKLYGPHPDEAFIGDPRSSSGFGCYAPVITKALNKLLTNGDTAVNITGTPLSQLLTDYIDKGQPVAIWATINMVQSTPGRQWYLTSNGSLFTWKRSEHCLVLVGYDDNYYYINDPYKGNGLKAYARSTVEARYTYMGSQAVIISQP